MLDCGYAEFVMAGTLAFILTFIEDLPVFAAPMAGHALIAATVVLAFTIGEHDMGIFVLFAMLAARSVIRARRARSPG